jgi:hypothetical protein
MTDLIELVEHALYRHKTTGDIITYAGAFSSGNLGLFKENGDFFKLSYKEFSDNYEDTGIHDHIKACCTVHNTHTSPHRGCLLR